MIAAPHSGQGDFGKLSVVERFKPDLTLAEQAGRSGNPLYNEPPRTPCIMNHPTLFVYIYIYILYPCVVSFLWGQGPCLVGNPFFQDEPLINNRGGY